MTAWPILRGLWDERDSRYARRVQNRLPLPLSPVEAAAVREYRRSEIDRLPADERAKAFLALNRWAPPEARL